MVNIGKGCEFFRFVAPVDHLPSLFLFLNIFLIFIAAPSVFADLLKLLFETIAAIVDKQESRVESLYGTGHMLRVLQRLQKEADVQSAIILDTFSESKQISRKASKAFYIALSLIHLTFQSQRAEIKQVRDASSNWRPTPNTCKESTIDSRELDIILNELASISQRTQLFDRFLHTRAKVAFGF
jgi:conserved oligomeric Golgi complex subunit 4